MDYETFVRQNPEFESASEGLVAAKITEAASRLDTGAWGSGYEKALEYMTADLLWKSPFGVAMRQDGADKAVSYYEEKFEALRLERIPRVMVL
jgi:hypothetical protein